MTFLGVWACQWRELRPISFGGSGATTQRVDGANAESSTQDIGDEEQGYGRGSRRGRGRDGAGEYEMVGMKAEDEPPQ